MFNHIFDASVNHTLALDNCDIIAVMDARFKSVIEEFTAEADSSGQTAVQFANIPDNSYVRGLEIVSLASGCNALSPVAPAGLVATAGDRAGIKNLK